MGVSFTSPMTQASFHHNCIVQTLPQKQIEESIQLTRPTRAYINLGAMQANLQSFYSHLSERASDPLLLPVVKANGYGHGALALTVSALRATHNGKPIVAGVAVATLEEAISLRVQLNNLGISCPFLLLLGVLPRGSENLLEKFNITPSICTAESLRRVISLNSDTKKCQKIHIKLDTGMHRVGFIEEEFEQILPEIKRAVAAGNIEVEGIYTHLSKADETDKSYTIQQLECFQRGLNKLSEEGIKVKYIHSMNSAGSIDFEQLSEKLPFTRDLKLFRIGVSLYGGYPSDEVEKSFVPLQPMMQWTSEVVQVKELAASKRVGYGGTYETPEPKKIAVLPVGYADGYRRLLGATKDEEAYCVLIKEQKCPIVGRVCMDMIMVDVSHINEVKEGEKAVLMGSDGALTLSCEQMAKRLSTINYEITCLVGERVPCVYLDDGNVVGIKSLYSTSIAEEWLNKLNCTRKE